MMKFDLFDIMGPVLITPQTFSDDRGGFTETFRAREFEKLTGSKATFVQDNQSFSKSIGTVRGLHFQAPPNVQGKLVRCIAGSIVDVAVDARRHSDTYGQHIRVILSAENMCQLWVPVGFLHGFSTLEANTIVAYKCTDYYARESDGNVRFDDPDLGIDWGLSSGSAILSDKDRKAPTFKSFESPF